MKRRESDARRAGRAVRGSTNRVSSLLPRQLEAEFRHGFAALQSADEIVAQVRDEMGDAAAKHIRNAHTGSLL
jgi:hypothetical protein